MDHLVHHCKSFHEILGPPVLDELGENFDLLGIVEHPRRISMFRLQHSQAADTRVVDFDPSLPPVEVLFGALSAEFLADHGHVRRN